MCSNRTAPRASATSVASARFPITTDHSVRKSVIAALTLGVLAAVATFRIVDQWQLRVQTIRTAEARANNLALILAAYIQESFVAGDSALRQLTLHSRRIGGP